MCSANPSLAPTACRGGLQHERRVAERSERNPEDTTGVALRGLSGSLQREPRLAAASGAGQRQQADVCSRNQLVHIVQLPLAAQEGRRGDRAGSFGADS